MKTSFAQTMMLVGSLIITAVLANEGYAYSDRQLGAAPSFEINNPVNGYASCYGGSYYYYKAWACSDTSACSGEAD